MVATTASGAEKEYIFAWDFEIIRWFYDEKPVINGYNLKYLFSIKKP
jgi:hypothetical protein